MDTQTVDTDDARLLHDAVENMGKMAEEIGALSASVESLTAIVANIPEPNSYTDDRIARALESIADTLSRLERS
jgi:spore coat protein CotH